ncbi:substrate-binding periplasmic protein [Halopseudomonas salegens]|uniref:Amino acid ABC transporter substrate-binding protein, PAAT family n=1 Tax=Halopseudomonas salegens TaxID=1434072 RepID=A0A1H2EUM0_9GAMM|nr:transporter substrate-binding domain-containing protein [Halopseudomonas salegens]SDT98663.1 amino acid ABC transporter substrate-binding protein, PAAT family [Halopseudomonas salegens]
MRVPVIVLFVWLLLTAQVLAGPKTVPVGGYVFPPFVDLTSQGEWRGITLDLLDELNRLQHDYHFEFYPTSAGRRYADLRAGHYELMLFENPAWGWPPDQVEGLKGLVMGQEVFIARRAQGRDQGYFADHEGKRIALFSGYHYAFADFINNKQYLRSKHNAVFTQSQESNVQMVLRGRVELGVVTDAWLETYLQRYPQYRDELLIGSDPDQLYQHFLLLRRGSTPDMATMRRLFERLKSNGALERVLVRHGINAIAD